MCFISDTKCVYVGQDLNCEVEGLQPCTHYNYKLRAFTEGDESPFSEMVVVVTEESGKILSRAINSQLC